MKNEENKSFYRKPAMLITVKEVATRIGASVPSVNRYRKDPAFPRPIVFSPGMVRFVAVEIDEWIESRRG